MDHRGLISSLFDFSFDSFITPKIQRFLYVLLLILAGLAGIAVLVAILGAAGGFFGKIGALIIGVPVAALLALFLAMYFRVMMEILIVVFKGVEYLSEISEQTRPRV